ncbi:MAG: hypothetical protein WCK11_03285 [Candidatus Falkowbacteria bacterium]
MPRRKAEATVEKQTVAKRVKRREVVKPKPRKKTVAVRVAKSKPEILVEVAKVVEPATEQPVVMVPAEQPAPVKPVARIISEEPLSQHRMPISRERSEREKRVMLWSGVSFFMLMFFGIWLFNLQTSLGANKPPADNKSLIELARAQNDFQKTMQEVSDGLSQLKEMTTSTPVLVDTNTTSAQIFSAPPPTNLVVVANSTENVELEALRQRIAEIEARLVTSSASTTR